MRDGYPDAPRERQLFVAHASKLAPPHRALWRRSSAPDSGRLAGGGRSPSHCGLVRRLDSQAYFFAPGGIGRRPHSLFGTAFAPYALLGLLRPDWVVADLGCGTGNGSECLAPYVDRVIAIDASLPMLDAARKRLSGRPNVEFRAGNLEALPLADASVDAAVCMLVLHHLAEPAAAMRELSRVLRPDRGGVALVVDMLPHAQRTTAGHGASPGILQGGGRGTFRAGLAGRGS